MKHAFHQQTSTFHKTNPPPPAPNILASMPSLLSLLTLLTLWQTLLIGILIVLSPFFLTSSGTYTTNLQAWQCENESCSYCHYASKLGWSFDFLPLSLSGVIATTETLQNTFMISFLIMIGGYYNFSRLRHSRKEYEKVKFWRWELKNHSAVRHDGRPRFTTSLLLLLLHSGSTCYPARSTSSAIDSEFVSPCS